MTYIAPTEDGKSFFGETYTADYPITFMGKQVVAKNPFGKRVLATLTLPYTNPKDKTKFASIHSNPPGIKTDTPSIVLGEYGKGKVIWSAASFERNAQKSHKAVFVNLIRHIFGGRQIIETDAPDFVQYTLFDDKEKNCAYFSAINVQEQMPIIKINDFHVRLRIDRDVKSVKLLPEGEAVPFEIENDALSFKINNIDIFKMYRIGYRD